jgi:hypothetical protein
MILGLTGKKQHGKDTVGRILVEEHGYRRLAYADALKESAAALFDIDPEKWNEWKNDRKATVSIVAEWYDSSDRSPEPALVPGFCKSITVREFLQRYGTEAHRDIFGESFWLDVIDKEIKRALHSGPPAVDHEDRIERTNIVVTDVRFDNEADLIRSNGGTVIEVYRPQVVDDADSHASEDLPRADLMLFNGDDIETLRQRIAQCVREGWETTLL